MFDLSKDIGEMTDLSKKRPEVTTELKTELNAYLESVDAQLPTKNPDYNPIDARIEMRQRRNRTAGRQRP